MSYNEAISNCMRYLESKEPMIEKLIGARGIKIPKHMRADPPEDRRAYRYRPEVKQAIINSIKTNGWIKPRTLATKYGCPIGYIQHLYKLNGCQKPNGNSPADKARRKAIAHAIFEAGGDRAEMIKKAAIACGVTESSARQNYRMWKLKNKCNV